MNDQANILRQLVLQETAGARSDAPDAARLIVVAAGKGGVGTTTVAVNLALALTHAGHGCVLVDGDPHSADATTFCGLDAQYGISHVVAGWRDALAPTPPRGRCRTVRSASRRCQDSCRRRRTGRLPA